MLILVWFRSILFAITVYQFGMGRTKVRLFVKTVSQTVQCMSEVNHILHRRNLSSDLPPMFTGSVKCLLFFSHFKGSLQWSFNVYFQYVVHTKLEARGEFGN